MNPRMQREFSTGCPEFLRPAVCPKDSPRADTIERMGFHSPGWGKEVPEEDRRNAFALVIYIPDPLGGFLDDLRRMLVPAYNPHAHVSVLPPRPLTVDWRDASAEAQALTEAAGSFEIELTDIRIFPRTDVIYIEVGRGAAELRRLHRALNGASFEFVEPFAYHPHITLAQGLTSGEVAAKYDLACREWQAFTGNRTFRAEQAVFVQNTHSDCWIDLAEYSFGRRVPCQAKI